MIGSKRMQLSLPSDGQSPELHYPLDNINDIYKYKTNIINSCKRFI